LVIFLAVNSFFARDQILGISAGKDGTHSQQTQCVLMGRKQSGQLINNVTMAMALIFNTSATITKKYK
jgi:hypothetical protein